MNKDEIVNAALPPSTTALAADETSTSQKDKQKIAGFFDLPNIPIQIPGVPGGNPIEIAKTAVIKEIGEAVGVGSPLLLDQKTAYPDVSDQVKDFHPQKLTITSAEDLQKPLPPGDYSLDVIAYCTQFSIHAPGQGLPYKLAPLMGKQAPAIGALLSRGTLQGIVPATLNADSWRIQAGLPLKQWPSQDQALIHKLIPEYEKGLEGDYLRQIENTYNQYRLVPGIPSFDDMLRQSGAPGKLVLQLRQARQTLADQTISAERLPDLLYEPTGDGLPRLLPPSQDSSPSRWAEIKPGIFARFTVIEGHLGRNLFEFRVTPKTSAAINDNSNLVATKELDKKVLVSEKTGTSATPRDVVCNSNHITYSKEKPAQALIPACVSDAKAAEKEPLPKPASLRIFFEDKDVTDKTQKVIVGQKIELTVSYSASISPESIQKQTWMVPGNTVGGYTPSPTTYSEGKKIPTDFTKSSARFFWITPGKSLEVNYSYELTNGERASAKTFFDIAGPISGYIKRTNSTNKVDIGQCDDEVGFNGECLRFGEKRTLGDISNILGNPVGVAFDGKVTFDDSSLSKEGKLIWVQIVSASIKNVSERKLCQFQGSNLLDAKFPYPESKVSFQDSWWLSSITDSPQVALSTGNEVSTSQFFRMYVMWWSKLPQSIPVPLGFVDWQWSGVALRDISSNNKWKLKSGESDVKLYQASLEYPVWTGTVQDKLKITCSPTN
ncbi:hypothetical protein [Nostoc sp. TCL26-01]|uniref:hypothetical protein n=1 Tax=Nostoc sp. TCL26-01 TaxID=2576904 RepID=UPI0015BFD8CC|nr:hypothetical protein [Nostoc sp. TCL26-01]QLE55432.1 hypothetical protein FD725_07830 [Nostoc sp. TCL26-01]